MESLGALQRCFFRQSECNARTWSSFRSYERRLLYHVPTSTVTALIFDGLSLLGPVIASKKSSLKELDDAAHDLVSVHCKAAVKQCFSKKLI